MDIEQQIKQIGEEYKKNPTIDKLNELRRAMVATLRVNGAYDGFLKLLTELYPDNAHFIYELLQNAEDTKANTVSFILSSESVEFKHNGEKLFTPEDVDSITNIALSSKRDEATSIGKFGVGFKAVFAYTDTPEIYSGKYSFKIKDLVVPESIEKTTCQENTHFVFPFNNKNKNPEIAIKEIKDGLRALDDSALLFLSNISKIEYSFPNCKTLGYLERIPLTDGTIQITAINPEGEKCVTNYLFYSKIVSVVDESDKQKECKVAIAYKLEKKKNLNGQEELRIVPAKEGRVCIFFPAAKEKSNLKFHIHAPFASTVARDSVRDMPANKVLLNALAELVAESLIDIKERNMLTMDFLAVMPIPDDNLSSFYEPIREIIIKNFKEKKLVPTKMGTYAAAQDLFKAPSVQISNVFDDDYASLLTNLPKPFWAKNAPQRNQREDKFLSSLKMREFGWDYIYRIFHPQNEDRKLEIEELVKKSDDAWLINLYALLNLLPQNYSEKPVESIYNSYEQKMKIDYNMEGIVDRTLKIIKCQIGDNVQFTSSENAYFRPNNTYFRPSNIKILPQNICFVAKTVYDTKYEARHFLEKIGVRQYDEKAIIELKLKEYTKKSAISLESHIRDILLFISYWKESSDLDENFLSCPFVKIQADVDEYKCPNELFIEIDGLRDVRHIIRKYEIWDGYKENLKGKEQLKIFILKLIDLGAIYKLSIVRKEISENPKRDYLFAALGRERGTGINQDYTIENIEEYLRTKSFAVSLLIWKTIISEPYLEQYDIKYAKYSKSQRSEIREAESYLVYYLKNQAWIPNNQNNDFYKPSAMTKDLLPEEFEYNDENGILTAIGFGSDAKNMEVTEIKNQQRIKEVLDILGLDRETVSKLREALAAGIPIEKINSVIDSTYKKSKPIFPTKAPPNPEHRKEVIENELKTAEQKTYEIKERSVKTSAPQVDPKPFLRKMYTNYDDKMVCQICQDEMPFKKRDGDYYFEDIQIFDKENMPKEHDAPYLALCPVCAAKYNEFVKSPKNQYCDIKKDIIDFDFSNSEDDYAIDIKFNEEPAKIRFTEKHLRDIKTVLNALEQNVNLLNN
jgi:hypothetical protein